LSYRQGNKLGFSTYFIGKSNLKDGKFVLGMIRVRKGRRGAHGNVDPSPQSWNPRQPISNVRNTAAILANAVHAGRFLDDA
jgi:hypothetical protein